MSDFRMAFNAVAPLFCVILLGCGARRRGYLNETEVDRINQWMFRLFMPMMTMNNIYTSDVHIGESMGLVAYCVGMTLAVWFAGLLFTVAVEKLPARRGVLLQAIYRSNMSVLAAPVVFALYPNDMGEAMLVLAFVVPSFNILAVLSLSLFSQTGVSLKKSLAGAITNPMVLGCAGGLLLKGIHIRLPVFLESVVSMIGSSTSVFLLFVLGAFFSFRQLREVRRDLIIGTVARLIVTPGIAILAAVLLGYRNAQLCIVMATFAAPVAIAAFAMSQQMGGDTTLCSGLIVVSCAFSSVTLCLWIVLLRSAGLMV